MARLSRLRWVLVMMMVMGVGNVSAESKVQEVVSPKGIKAWLIESHTLPMVSVEVNFRGGSAFEPAGKEGLAHLASSLFDEGAGQYDAKEFKEELEAIGARFGGSADVQDININLTTLTDKAPRAFELMGLAINQPRIDADALSRMKDAMLADIRQGDEDPATVAWRLFRPAVFGSHPYANSGEGTLQSVAALKADDVKAWLKANVTRANMVVSVVGDVTPAQLGALLDEALAEVPQGDHRNAIAKGPEVTVPGVTHKKMDVPQGTVLMGQLGLPRTDPDYYPMLVMNEILGGGVLTSRLGADVREKHGLVYDVRSVNNPLPFNGMFYVSLATDNAKVEQALELVRKHLNLIRDEKVPEGEFDDAKAYLVGSFPLRADSNGKLLQMLAMMQSEGLGTDYMQQWPKKIAAVTVADVQRVAQRLIQPNGMALVVVGDGPALEAK
jgi:zinc protease